MSRALMVHINGITQSPVDFVTKGNRIVFKQAPYKGAHVECKAITRDGIHTNTYTGTGSQTTFNLPAWPRFKFEVIANSHESVPEGYTIVDVDNEIDSWIRDNCLISDWKWADQLDRDPSIQFGMTRLIIKDSVLTYIATKW